MKINEVYSVVGQYNQNRIQRTQTQKPQAMGTDKIELSSFAKLYSDAMAAAKKDAETSDPAYTAHLKDVAARVESGAYEVSAREVSAKMLGNL